MNEQASVPVSAGQTRADGYDHRIVVIGRIEADPDRWQVHYPTGEVGYWSTHTIESVYPFVVEER